MAPSSPQCVNCPFAPICKLAEPCDRGFRTAQYILMAAAALSPQLSKQKWVQLSIVATNLGHEIAEVGDCAVEASEKRHPLMYLAGLATILSIVYWGQAKDSIEIISKGLMVGAHGLFAVEDGSEEHAGEALFYGAEGLMLLGLTGAKFQAVVALGTFALWSHAQWVDTMASKSE